MTWTRAQTCVVWATHKLLGSKTPDPALPRLQAFHESLLQSLWIKEQKIAPSPLFPSSLCPKTGIKSWATSSDTELRKALHSSLSSSVRRGGNAAPIERKERGKQMESPQNWNKCLSNNTTGPFYSKITEPFCGNLNTIRASTTKITGK